MLLREGGVVTTGQAFNKITNSPAVMEQLIRIQHASCHRHQPSVRILLRDEKKRRQGAFPALESHSL